jgi:hypothetical protein
VHVEGFRLTRFQYCRDRVIGDSQVRATCSHIVALELLADTGAVGLGFGLSLFHPLPALAELERVFREVDRLADTARELRAAGGNRLRAIVPPSLSYRFLPETLRRFVAAHPETRLDIDYGPAAAGKARSSVE